MAAGGKAYFLQSYRESGQVIRSGLDSFNREQLEEMQKRAAEYIPQAALRG